MLSKTIKGFTLIELLVSLVITAIIFCFATPSWHATVSQTEKNVVFDQLITAINLARTEAIKRNVTVTLCTSNTKSNCSGDWKDGQILFIDPLGKGKLNDKKDIIAVFNGLPNTSRLQWKSTHNSHFLQIRPDGSLNGNPGRFIYCPATSENVSGQSLVISTTGRVRISNEPVTCL